jgi:hypothetical protein
MCEVLLRTLLSIHEWRKLGSTQNKTKLRPLRQGPQNEDMSKPIFKMKQVAGKRQSTTAVTGRLPLKQ